MQSYIVKVRFNGGNSQREYSYYTPIQLEIGQIVIIEVRQEKNVLGTVTQIDVPEETIESFKDKMKSIVGKYVDTKINLCETCEPTIPECPGADVEFSDGVGNDNVIKCDGYKKKEIAAGYNNCVKRINEYVEGLVVSCDEDVTDM